MSDACTDVGDFLEEGVTRNHVERKFNDVRSYVSDAGSGMQRILHRALVIIQSFRFIQLRHLDTRLTIVGL